jgi:hypothetical protein
VSLISSAAGNQPDHAHDPPMAGIVILFNRPQKNQFSGKIPIARQRLRGNCRFDRPHTVREPGRLDSASMGLGRADPGNHIPKNTSRS